MSAGRLAAHDQSVPTISKYSGADVGEEDETIEDWLDQFQLIASVFEWDDKMWLMHLVTHLKGSALAFYRSCSPAKQSSWEQLSEALRERFTPVHVQSVQSALFHGHVQKYQEPVESYGQELKHLFQRAYPTMAREESRECAGITVCHWNEAGTSREAVGSRGRFRCSDAEGSIRGGKGEGATE